MPSIRFAFWTRTFAFPTLVALALFPLACITDGNTKKSEVVVREHNQEMKSIQSEKGFFISLASDWDCNADPDTLTYASDTTYYQIENGKLWAWQGGACLAHGYTGCKTAN